MNAAGRPRRAGWRSCSRSAAMPARALGDAAIDAGMPRAAVTHFDNSTDGAPRDRRPAHVRRCGAGQGIARHAHRSRRGAPDGGVRLMLYHLLHLVLPAGLRLQRGALHHVPHGGGEHDGARHQPGDGAVADSSPARFPDRAGDPPGRSGVASRQGRHADDGRAADPCGGAHADAAVGRPHQHLRLDRGVADRRLRRHRLPRRLPEDHAPIVGRTRGRATRSGCRSWSACWSAWC